MSNEFQELDKVFLNKDVDGIPRNTKGVIVDLPKKFKSICLVEFFDDEGNTIDVVSVLVHDLTKLNV